MARTFEKALTASPVRLNFGSKNHFGHIMRQVKEREREKKKGIMNVNNEHLQFSERIETSFWRVHLPLSMRTRLWNNLLPSNKKKKKKKAIPNMPWDADSVD